LLTHRADYNITQFMFSQCRRRFLLTFFAPSRLCVKKIQLDVAGRFKKEVYVILEQHLRQITGKMALSN